MFNLDALSVCRAVATGGGGVCSPSPNNLLIIILFSKSCRSLNHADLKTRPYIINCFVDSIKGEGHIKKIREEKSEMCKV